MPVKKSARKIARVWLRASCAFSLKQAAVYTRPYVDRDANSPKKLKGLIVVKAARNGVEQGPKDPVARFLRRAKIKIVARLPGQHNYIAVVSSAAFKRARLAFSVRQIESALD